jgi:hypothetical protein
VRSAEMALTSVKSGRADMVGLTGFEPATT